VYGKNLNGNNCAGYFDGVVHVTGTFTQNSDVRLKQEEQQQRSKR